MRFRLTALAAVLAVVAFSCNEESPSAADTTSPPPLPTNGQANGSAGDPARGETLFGGTCQVCHGPGGEGIEGLGKTLQDNEFIQARTDEEMVAFIVEGRLPDDPENTTGIAMPPRGANPSLTDADLLDIVAFLRTLQT